MMNNLNYTIRQSDHISASKMCTTCHNLKTPYVDENGNMLSMTSQSEFPDRMPPTTTKPIRSNAAAGNSGSTA